MNSDTRKDKKENSSGKRNSATHEGFCGSFDRILALSDGVFAFAITLLALSLIVPQISDSVAQTELSKSLIQMAPAILSYLISFMVIASWWKSHHKMFSYIKRCNGTLIQLNIYFLLCITFIPFLTNLIINYGEVPLATILFAVIQVVTGTILLTLWIYATKDHRLISPALSQKRVAYISRRGVAIIGIFLISVPIALVNTTIAQISWIAIPPVALLLQRAYKDIEEYVDEEEESRERQKQVPERED